MITIEKGRYRTLLKRVFGFVDSANGEAIHKVIGSKISDLGRNLRHQDSPDVAQVNAVFEDLQLLHEFYLLEMEPAPPSTDIPVEENTIPQEIPQEIPRDTTFG